MGKKKDLEIIYNLHWKNKPENGPPFDDKANIIGMYDIPATTLNWRVFKAYLLKNSGCTGDDVRVSYVTSNNREFPIESHTDFQIALYAFRRKARLNEIINLNLERISNQESVPSTSQIEQKTNDVETQSEVNEMPSSAASNDFSTPPEWFLNFMAQYKKEIVEEVTASMSNVVSNIKPHTVSQPSCYHSRKSKVECPKRRKLPHLVGESSNEKDLLKSLKLEYKLENKLEKLERKTKKIKEKKLALFTKSSDSDAGHSSSRSRSNHVQEDDNEDELQMDGAPVNDLSVVPHMLGGEIYLHRWEVINVGKAAWSSKTTLNFTWGSKTLQPLDTVVSCPYLQPMEKGVITVRFQVPREPGQYESYWRFHHHGRRFGQWLGCQIIVDPFDLKGHFSVLETSKLSDLASAVPMHYENLYTMNIKPEETQKPIVDKPDGDNKQNILNDMIKEEVYASDQTDLSLCSWDSEPESLKPIVVGKNAENEDKKENLMDEMVKEVSSSVANLTLKELGLIPGIQTVDTQSIASATDSNSSKNEEFVVIPTPSCFKLDEEVDDKKTGINSIKIENTTEKTECTEKASTSNDNYDDNNNTEETNQNSSSESIGKVEDELPSDASQKSDMVFVNLPTDEEIDAKGYAFLMVDGVAIPVPKKYLKEEYLNNATASTVAEIKPPCVTEQKPVVDAEEITTDSIKEVENTDLSHCSAAGSCFSDANTAPSRLFIFPQNVAGYEVLNTNQSDGETTFTQSTPNLHARQYETADSYMKSFREQPPSAPQCYPINYCPVDPNNSHATRPPHHVREFYNIPPNAPEEYDNGADMAHTPEHYQRLHQNPGNVQILPETLMSGVVNVASSAINTARSVINIMKPREPGRWVNGHWVTSNAETPREANLRALAEMGFWDRDLNATLLQRYNDDLNRVVSELVQ